MMIFPQACFGIFAATDLTASLKRLRQPRLPENSICGVAASNPSWHRKIPLCEWTVPNFMTAFALPYEAATRRAQQVSQGTV
jgi:hypothetical protein